VQHVIPQVLFEVLPACGHNPQVVSYTESIESLVMQRKSTSQYE